MENKSEIVLYKTEDGQTSIDVRLEEETVWLNQLQMAALFNQSKQNISLHINNIFKEKELEKKATVKEYLTVQKEGKRVVTREVENYNLDVIISVGYRVKSKRGTQFRIWANGILKNYLVKGYAVNEKRLKETNAKLSELKSAVKLFIGLFSRLMNKREWKQKLHICLVPVQAQGISKQ